MRVLVTVVLLIPLASACTWVKMAPGAKDVRVARADQDLSACTPRGEVSVSVKDRLGPYERNSLKVRDELETLARNEAPSLGADTVKPKNEPNDGEQRFLAFRCGNAILSNGAPAPRQSVEGPAETYPIAD